MVVHAIIGETKQDKKYLLLQENNTGLQLQICQDNKPSVIDLNYAQAKALADKLNQWIKC